MIELGTQITLDGFESLEPAKLVVVKKFVGTHAKKLSEQKGVFEKLEITLKEEGGFEVAATLTKGGKKIEEKDTDANLFFALGKVFEELTKHA